jgi:hypothetical protein
MEKHSTISKSKELEELKKWFHQQLKLRDDEIERLKQQNRTLFNSLLKQKELSLPPLDNEKSELFGKAYKSKLK